MKKIIVSLCLLPVALFAQTTLTVPGGGNVTYCASHTDANNVNLDGWKAFDQGGTYGFNSSNSRWLARHAAMPEAYIIYEFRGSTVIDSYAVFGLHSDNSGANRSPKSWTLDGTDDILDDNSWVVADTQTNQTLWSSLQIRRFETAYTNSFKYWRFTMHENNGAGDYVGIQELEYYGYADFTEQPVVSSLPYEQAGAGAIRVIGSLDYGGSATAFVAWGDAPGNLTVTNEIGEVTALFDYTIDNLALFQTGWYTLFATNSFGIGELPASVPFTTRGPVFYWNRGSSNGQWDDAANWNDADGVAGIAFPNAPGDVAVVTNSTATITLWQDIVVGEIVCGAPPNSYAAPTFNSPDAGAKFIFDNGANPAILCYRNITNVRSPQFLNDWEIRNSLDIDNESAQLINFRGKISGANTDIAINANIFSWNPFEDTVYSGNLSSSGNGMFRKEGSRDLMLVDGTHSARFGSQYSEGDNGGLHGDGSLTISGGTYTNVNAERPYLFGNANGYVVFTNGAHFLPSGGTSLGRPANSTNSTVIVTGDGTVWGGVQTIGINKSNFIVRDGGRAEMGTVSLSSSGFVKISGVDPLTGAPAWMNLNGNALWIPQNGITPANRVEVSDGGVLSNGTVRLHAQYSGSTNSCIEVSNGGRVQASLIMAQGGDQEGDVIGNHVIVTGDDSMWIYPAAGTVQIGPRAPNARGVWHDRDNFVKVEKGGVFTNAAFNIGYCGNSNNQESFGNHLIVTDGGKVFSTQDSCIGQTQSTGSNYSLMQGHYALVGDGEAESLWSLGGKNLRIGRSDGTNGWAVANHLEARSRGTVNNIATLYVGTSDVNANSNNFVRLTGGTVSATAMDIKKNNGLEVVIDSEAPGAITIANTAAFSSDTFVRARKTKDSTTGRYVIVSAASISDAGITLSPDTDRSVFKLEVTGTEVILHHFLPRTLFMLR